MKAQSGPGTTISRNVTPHRAEPLPDTSPTAHARAERAIRGYPAIVDAEAVGLTFEAPVFVTMKQEDRETLLAFEDAVIAIPNVLQAQRPFGDPDHLLRVRTTDLAAYAEREDDRLSALPGVQRLTSTLVMKQVVTDRAIPT